MEYGPKKAPKPELVLTPEMEFKGDFENILGPEEFLDAVDFKTLNDIYDELSVKSGAKEAIDNTGHRVERDKIRFVAEQPTENVQFTIMGSAWVRTGEIDLLWNQDESSPITPALAVRMLGTLTHEAAHIRGGYDHRIYEQTFDGKNYSGFVITKTGVERVFRQAGEFGNKNEVLGLNLNEAITENISREVLREYLTRTGNSSYLKDEETLKKIGVGAYYQERLLFACLLQVLSDELELPKDEIWKSFVQTYMNNGEEISSLITDIEETITNSTGASILIHSLTQPTQSEDFIGTDFALDLATNGKAYSEEAEMRRKALNTQIEILRGIRFNTLALQNALGLRK